MFKKLKEFFTGESSEPKQEEAVTFSESPEESVNEADSTDTEVQKDTVLLEEDPTEEKEETADLPETAEPLTDLTEENEIDMIQEVSEEEIAVTENQEPEEIDDSPAVENNGLFARLKAGLSKTAQNFTGKLDQLFQGHIKIDEELYEEIEEILITADIGFETTIKIVDTLKENIRKKSIQDVSGVREELKIVIEELLSSENNQLNLEPFPSIMVIVGVNGVGKTTSIGKIAMKLKKEGKSVMLAAADTFRAAAAEQLTVWAERAGVEIVKHQEGADPSAVIFDGIHKAKANKTQVLICDTAGRLHNKKNLMQELSKIFRIIDREYPEAKKEVLLVIDATTGQNAINQVKLFKEAAPLDGIILTKLDGTAKGGVVLSIKSGLEVPIKLIGVGEKIEDLQEFDAKSFANALFEGH